MNTKQRSYGIDLLRLVSMFMVCLLHTLERGGILKACQQDSLDCKVYLVIEVVSYCAVDIFAIISGYVASEKRPHRYEKIAGMWLQVFFYSFVVTVILALLMGRQSIAPIDLVKCAFPVLFSKFWYFTGYFLLFFAMPVLNKFLFSLDKDSSKKMLVILFILFSVSKLFNDPFKVSNGYAAIWLIVLYCIGVLAKRIELFANKSSWTLVGLLIGCSLITWAGYLFAGIKSLLSYASPFVLMSGILWVILFSRLQLKGTIIRRFAPLAFGIYLFQLNHIIWRRVLKDAFVFCVEKSIIVGVAYVFAIAAGIFVSGLIVEFIRVQLFKLLRIQMLAERVTAFAGGCVGRMVKVLD